jgi:hypothetical protein
LEDRALKDPESRFDVSQLFAVATTHLMDEKQVIDSLRH